MPCRPGAAHIILAGHGAGPATGMTFTETRIGGVWLVEGTRLADERGFFTVAFIRQEFADRGLETAVAQVNVASNHQRGTVRGMHYQAPPFEEVKLVRVVRGAVFDVAVDLRPGSPTFRQWVGVELAEEEDRMLYVPRGCAHGYQTLTDDAEIYYFVSAPYSPPHQRGVRWNDPAFGIEWPIPTPAAINARDAGYPDFRS